MMKRVNRSQCTIRNNHVECDNCRINAVTVNIMLQQYFEMSKFNVTFKPAML